MTDKYKEYLASGVLSDGNIVTYRELSRAIKVHVHMAKQMLYDFHKVQNSKKPKSVHATYLLSGVKHSAASPNGTNGTHENGEGDTVMQSSPFQSSMPESEEPAEPLVKRRTNMLAREEELDKAKADFQELTHLYIYSLEPGPIENMNMISVCNQKIARTYGSEDPLQRWKAYGSIHNPFIKRRTARYAPPAAPAAAAAPKPVAKQEKETVAPLRRGSTSEDSKSGTSTPTLKKADSKPNLKRDKSDIFKSFAKAKAKPKEATKSKESTPVPAEDEPMGGMSEDEDGDENPEIEIDEEKAAAARKARAEKKAELEAMMEGIDDEEMQDAPPPAEEKAAEDTPASTEPVGSETAVTTENGRRRGRRRVMKKRTVKDDEGYLVTKEEAAWESFSEDEPQPKRPKPAPKPAPAAKGKKGAKQGQGSIANFFKKA